MEKEEKKLHLELDADKLRFSEIVKLRKIFHQFPGSASVLLAFLSEKKKIGTVEIESKGRQFHIQNHFILTCSPWLI